MSAIVKADAADIAVELPQIFRLAQSLVKAGGFLPRHIRTEGELVAVILAGRELGLPPMTSLRSIHLVEGRVVLAADAQLALMLRAGIVSQWLSDGGNGSAQLRLQRAGQPPHTQTYTIKDAQTAGLAGKDNWRKNPAAMLRARCVSGAAKAYCPDILAGVYVPGEIEADDAVEAEYIDDQGEVKRAAPPTVTIDATPVAAEKKFDEYGLVVPSSPCPVIGPGKPNAGKSWDKLNGPVIEKMYAEFGDKMSAVQKEWAEYLMAKRQARKAKEARDAEVKAAQEAAFATANDASSDGGSYLADDGDAAEPPAAEVAQ